MKRLIAAGLLAGALAAHAQAPPASPPPASPPPAEAPPTAAGASQTQESQAPPVATGAVPAETAAPPAPATRPPPAAKPAAPRNPPAKPPAAAPQSGPRDAEVAALREEIHHLESELDSARAAALPAAEDAGSGPPPARSPWGWLIVTALAGLGAGFLLGWRLLDRRIRRKYGGLRIY